MPSMIQNDLIILLPDRDYEAVFDGLLNNRTHALGIRDITYEKFRYVHKDAGCRKYCADVLRPHIRQFLYAIVIFDHEGCGTEHQSRIDIEAELEANLSFNGWANRSSVIVISPELEMWIWSDSPEVDEILGWAGIQPSLRSWLKSPANFLDEHESKPGRPKEALEATLRNVRKPKSPSLFQELAERVSLHRCTDPSFIKLKSVLVNWFGI